MTHSKKMQLPDKSIYDEYGRKCFRNGKKIYITTKTSGAMG